MIAGISGWTKQICAFAVLSVIVLAQPNPEKAEIQYTVSLKDPVRHLVEIQIQIPPGSATHDLQLPVWNATYQIRDFSQYVNWVRATARNREPLKIVAVEKSRWQVVGTQGGATIDYEIVAPDNGPFGAEFNSQHAFFNLAEILMYPLDARSSPMHVSYVEVPKNWQAATSLSGDLSSGFRAANYDDLVDAPIELSAFRESDFDENGAHYRIVVDADNDPVSLADLTNTVRRIIVEETEWMKDRPFDRFLFIYHFPGVGGGGMEHAYSTAITLNPEYLREHPGALADVTAHEFFHLWNVKRLRPQSLEPVDYARENYTRALWFSEGVTSTVGEYALLGAGLIDEQEYLSHLSSMITELEARPAHLTQSAEESSLDTWLEKYPYYLTPERSISYYDKGELLGVLLDLQIQEVTHGANSLRDLFQWMNKNYAKYQRSFPDSTGVRLAAETISGADFKLFFEKYVAGTEEIPWDKFFQVVGLRLAKVTTQLADPGFDTTSNFNDLPRVSSVDPSSGAEQAGLRPGDVILEVNGKPANRRIVRQLSGMTPGTPINLMIRSPQGERQLQWTLPGREREELELKDVDGLTSMQIERRNAWLKGDMQQTTPDAATAGVEAH